jgi:rod shape-determining protein MreD
MTSSQLQISGSMHTNFIKSLTLYLIAILFAIFNLSDIKSSATISYIPLFDIMMIFYFTVYRTGIFALWFLVILGIWSDALNGLPLGVTSLCYIIAVKFFIALNQRLMMKENFRQILEQFVAFIFLVLMLKWLLLSIYNLAFYNITAALVQVALSSVLYVIMHKFFDYLSFKLLNISN